MSIPFTELPIPKRTKEYVVIVKQIDVAESAFCTTLIGNGLCQLLATWQCAICNSWTCDLHEYKTQTFRLHGGIATHYSICESCGKLSRDDQRRTYEFQAEMNEG